MEPSIFTKITNGEIPSHKIYEDERTFAFLDIHPTRPGHVLVVPKSQVEFVWDLPANDYQALMRTVQLVALRLREVLNVPYVGEKIIGEDVPHAHVHVIPLTEAAELYNRPDMSAEPDHAALAEMSRRLAF